MNNSSWWNSGLGLSLNVLIVKKILDTNTNIWSWDFELESQASLCNCMSSLVLNWDLSLLKPVPLAPGLMLCSDPSLLLQPTLCSGSAECTQTGLELPLHRPVLSEPPANSNTPALPYGHSTLPAPGLEPKPAGPEWTESSRGLSRASCHLSKRCIHYPSCTLGMFHSLFTKRAAWQSLFKHDS